MNKNIAQTALLQEDNIQLILFKFLDLLDIDFYKNLETYKALFIKEFEVCCGNIVNLQKTKDFKVGNMVFTLLRTNMLDKVYEYPLYIYNKNWYLDKRYVVGHLSFQHIYAYYNDFYEAILLENKKAFSKLPLPDVEYRAMRCLDYFHNYVVALARYSIFDAIQSDIFYEIKKEIIFQMHTGEYFEPCALFYKEIAEKNYTKLRYLIKSHKDKDGCAFEDFSGIDLTNINGQGLNYYFSDFRKSIMNSTNFLFSDLTECVFSNSKMANCSFSVSILSGATFENCMLQNADFRYALASIGNKFGGIRQKYIYTGLTFKNSCLKGADFSYAVLKGADFRGADLSDAIFTGTALFRTHFSKKQAERIAFSEEQKKQIIID